MYKKTARITACVWLALQIIVIIVYWNHPATNDDLSYCRRALLTLGQGSTYPSMANLYDDYIHAPGLVNLLAAVYWVFGTFKANYVLNLLLNVGVLAEVYYLGKKVFNQRVACLSVIFYCCILSHLFVPLHNISDHPAYFLSLSGLCLCMGKRWWQLVAAGLLFAAAYTFRPTVMAFVACGAVYLLLHRARWTSFVALFATFFVALVLVGQHNRNQTGIFVTTSILAGYGLAHSANPETQVYANVQVFDHPHNEVTYIHHRHRLTFAQKDSIWRARAANWIANNPCAYAKLALPRVLRSYSTDWWTLEDVVVVHDYDRAMRSDNPSRAMKLRRTKQFVESIPYYLVVLLFGFSLIINRKRIFSYQGGLLVITALALGYATLSIAELRFHYAFVFVMVLWAAYGVDTWVQRRHVKRGESSPSAGV